VAEPSFGRRTIEEPAAAVRFSIITVVRNDRPGLERTAASVSRQTHGDLEWIVVDGASDDGTAQWLETNSEIPSLTWLSESDQGRYDAMNKGIERALGDYLVFMNAGDELADPHVLARVASAAAAAEAPPDLVYGDAIDVRADGKTSYRTARDHKSLWWTMFACHQAMFFRRSSVGTQRYRLRYPLAADYAFVAEFLGRSRSEPSRHVVKIDAPLCRFWLGGASWVHRRSTISQDFHIRATLLEVALPVNVALFLVQHAHTWAKRRLPDLSRAMRERTTV
jgi:putative colanic acid biosynthesis glycosyltransferase